MLEQTWKLFSLRCWVFQKWRFGAGSLEERWKVKLQLWWEWPGYILSWLQNLAVASIQCSFCLQEHLCKWKTHRGLHRGLRKLPVRVISIAGTPYQANPWSCEAKAYIWIETSGCLRCQNCDMSNKDSCRQWSQSERETTHASELGRQGCRWGLHRLQMLDMLVQGLVVSLPGFRSYLGCGFPCCPVCACPFHGLTS